MKITKEEIEKALDAAYKEAGHNAYFGNGFMAGVEFIEEQECIWVRAFDGHFNISCADMTGKRANGNFKGKDVAADWEFTYCPYCGRKILVTKNEGDIK